MPQISYAIKFQSLVYVFFYSIAIFAGDSVNNGAGLAEQNFWSTYVRLPQIYQACIDSPYCQMGSAEKKLIGNLLASFPFEQKTKNQLNFLENQSQTFFLKDGVVLVAQTQPDIGALIWINRDVIYSPSSSNQSVAYSSGQALAVLTEQLLIHQKVENTAHRFYIAHVLEKFYEKSQFKILTF